MNIDRSKWEYMFKVFLFDSSSRGAYELAKEMTKELNDEGDQYWDLFSLKVLEGYVMVCLKRRKS